MSKRSSLIRFCDDIEAAITGTSALACKIVKYEAGENGMTLTFRAPNFDKLDAGKRFAVKRRLAAFLYMDTDDVHFRQQGDRLIVNFVAKQEGGDQ